LLLLTTNNYVSNLRIKIEERFRARPQLLLDVFFAAFQNVHGHVRGLAVLQCKGGVFDGSQFVGRQQSHSID